MNAPKADEPQIAADHPTGGPANEDMPKDDYDGQAWDDSDGTVSWSTEDDARPLAESDDQDDQYPQGERAATPSGVQTLHDNTVLKTAAALHAIIANPSLTDQRAKDAALWLAEQPQAIRLFLTATASSFTEGRAIRYRGSMVEPPRLSEEIAATHRGLFNTVGHLLCNPPVENKTASPLVTDARYADALAAVRSAYLLHLEEQYRATESPLHATRAYRVSRAAGEPIPDWVLAHLDGWAAAVEEIAAAPPERLPDTLARKFGFLRDKAGPRGVFSEVSLDHRRKAVFHLIEHELASGTPRVVAVANAAKRFGITRENARAYYRHCKTLLESGQE